MATYQLISSVTVGAGGAANIQFTSIPNTYTDLLIKLSGRDTFTGSVWNNLIISFGSATYTYRSLVGTGSAAASGNDTGSALNYIATADATANTFGNSEIYIPNYLSTTNKSFSIDNVTENNATAALTGLAAVSANYTSAITSITLTPASSKNFVQYSTAYLYGIKNS